MLMYGNLGGKMKSLTFGQIMCIKRKFDDSGSLLHSRWKKKCLEYKTSRAVLGPQGCYATRRLLDELHEGLRRSQQTYEGEEVEI